MTTRKLYRYALTILGLDLVTIFVLFSFIAGAPSTGLFLHTGEVPNLRVATVRAAAIEDPESANTKTLSIKIKNGGGVFKVGEPIEITCTFEHNFPEEFQPYEIILKTNLDTIKQIRIHGDNENEFTGTYTPEHGGLIPVACRSDWHDEIEERSEKDNRFLTHIYVME